MHHWSSYEDNLHERYQGRIRRVDVDTGDEERIHGSVLCRVRATVTRADGDKQAAILKAEGKLEASRREAEAQVILAQASQTAIELVTSAVGDKELPVAYLLGEKYITSLQNLSASENSKFVVFPADIPAAIKGMMGSR